jgi:pimeloyl-ACP methyl ester carboxylesterase
MAAVIYYFLVIDQIQVHYAECQAANVQESTAQGQSAVSDDVRVNPPVLYIHGNLGSHLWYSRVMEVEGRRVIALDLPNFGKSDALGECSISAYGKFVIKFIEKLELGPVILVGHSLGGAVAMETAVTRPDLAAALCLVDSSPINGLVTPTSYYPVIESYKTDRNMLKAALRAVVPALDDEEFFERLVSDAAAMQGKCFIGHAEALGKADFTDRAGNYSGPVLCLTGEKDILINEDMAAAAAEAFGGSYEVLPGVGHSVIVENPRLFLEKFTGFLAELD